PVVFSPTTLLRQAFATPNFQEENYNLQADLVGKVDVLGMKHTLLLGYEFDYFDGSGFVSQASDPFTTVNFFGFTFPTGASSPIAEFTPNHTPPTPPLPGHANAALFQPHKGFFVQALIDIPANLKLLAGARYDIVDQSFFEDVNIIAAGFPA